MEWKMLIMYCCSQLLKSFDSFSSRYSISESFSVICKKESEEKYIIRREIALNI